MIKLLHMLSMLAFVALFVVSCFSRKKAYASTAVSYQRLKVNALALLATLFLSVVLGALLVHQKGYYFSTPWIHAALVFSFILFCLLLAQFYLQRKRLLEAQEFALSDKVRLWVIQLLSFAVIVAVIHDAITKTTGLL